MIERLGEGRGRFDFQPQARVPPTRTPPALRCGGAIAVSGWQRAESPVPIGLELVVSKRAALDGGADPANHIGGVCDVLQAERRNVPPTWLGELAGHALYENDSQVREIHYREDSLAPAGYQVRIWRL